RRCERLLDLFLRYAPRIDILSGFGWIDRQKRLTLVFECRGDWSLRQPVQGQQILRCRRRTSSLVELFERAKRRECFGVSLFLVELLKDLPGFDQLRHRLSFTLR